MTVEEIEALIANLTWRPLGKGGFNDVFVSDESVSIGSFTGRWVLKKPQTKNTLSNSKRAVRKWNSINPNFPAYELGDCWLAPYLGERHASDEQIAEKIIDIYRQTGNIIGDAAAVNNNHVAANFLVYGSNNDVVCIDVDHAFHRLSSDSKKNFFEAYEIDSTGGKVPYFDATYKPFLEKCAAFGFQETVDVIKTLLYLDKYRSHILDEEICEPFIKKLRIFRDSNAFITNPLIVKLFFTIIELDPLGEFDNYLSPRFIFYLMEAFKPKVATAELKTKEILGRYISFHLLKENTFEKILREKDLNTVKLVLQYNRDLLQVPNENGLLPLHLALTTKNIELIRYLMAAVNIHEKRLIVDRRGFYTNMSFLDFALQYNCDVAIDLLIEAGVDSISPNRQLYMLNFAARIGRIDLVKSIIEKDRSLIHKTDINNQTALLWAASRGQNAVVQYLLAEGANQNTSTRLPIEFESIETNHYSPLDWAISGGHTETILTLNQAGAIANRAHSKIKDKTLEELIKVHDLESLKILIEYRPVFLGKDEQGFTPLHYAAAYGTVDIVRYLIEKAVALDVLTPSNAGEYSNITAMDVALARHDDEIVILLLQQKAKVSAYVPSKFHPIHIAAKNGLYATVKELIENEPRLVDVADEYGQTPLLFAASRGHNEIIQFLIAKGANVNAKTILPPARSSESKNGRSALEWARLGKHNCTVLLSAEAIDSKQPEKNTAVSLYSIYRKPKNTAVASSSDNGFKKA